MTWLEQGEAVMLLQGQDNAIGNTSLIASQSGEGWEEDDRERRARKEVGRWRSEEYVRHGRERRDILQSSPTGQLTFSIDFNCRSHGNQLLYLFATQHPKHGWVCEFAVFTCSPVRCALRGRTRGTTLLSAESE